MYQGRSDSAVTRLQQKLVEYGYLSKASGVYDSATIKAVKQIQGIMGLQQSDGLASRELQAFLQTRGSAKLKK
jgi:peptidoglycan hydrolase-like protein with peptidoglycan-binding domain